VPLDGRQAPSRIGAGGASRPIGSLSVKISGSKTRNPTAAICPQKETGTVQGLRVLPVPT